MEVDGFEVANVYGSSCDKRNWSAFWEKHTELRLPNTCRIDGCSKTAAVGGHMYVKGMKKQYNIILPICKSHNNNKDLDCGTEACRWFLPVKPGSVGVLIEQHVGVPKQRDIMDKLLQDMASTSLGGITLLKHEDQMLDLIDDRADAYIMVTMEGCGLCNTIYPKFQKSANGAKDDMRYYLIMNHNQSQYHQFPTIIDARTGKDVYKKWMK
jgi:hypothetical protein